MIPSIETIVEDLAAGRITKAQATAWLNEHAEAGVNDRRDMFAGFALQAYLVQHMLPPHEAVAEAWAVADLMMDGRKA